MSPNTTLFKFINSFRNTELEVIPSKFQMVQGTSVLHFVTDRTEMSTLYLVGFLRPKASDSFKFI